MKLSVTEILGLWILQGMLTAVVLFLISFFLSLGIVSFVLVMLPSDYFSESNDRKISDKSPGWTRIISIVGKNLLGVILVLVGILLSIPGVPGQGLLTILLGVMLLDFPGKRELERKIVCRHKVRDAIDRLRQRFGKPPLVLE